MDVNLSIDDLIIAADKEAEALKQHGYSRDMSYEEKKAFVEHILEELERYGYLGNGNGAKKRFQQ